MKNYFSFILLFLVLSCADSPGGNESSTSPSSGETEIAFPLFKEFPQSQFGGVQLLESNEKSVEHLQRIGAVEISNDENSRFVMISDSTEIIILDIPYKTGDSVKLCC